jgi:hypothetical protein
MAQDAQKGFFWSIQYWLGFWLSAWFTVALEISIPLAFGYFDYGLLFFIFTYTWIFIACFFLFHIIWEKIELALFSAAFFTSFYLLFNSSVSETIYWNIGALAYSGALAIIIFSIGIYFSSEKNLRLEKSHVDFFFLFPFFIFFISVYFYKFKKLKFLIRYLDQLIPYQNIYLIWIFIVIIIFLVFKLSKNFYFSNFLLCFIFLFLSVGSGPQSALFINLFFSCLLLYKTINKDLNFTLSIFCFLSGLMLTIIILNLPGTQNRIGLTYSDAEKNLSFIKNGIFYLFDHQFLKNGLLVAYISIFFIGILLTKIFHVSVQEIKYSIIYFSSILISIFLVSIFIYFNANGHFPSRLTSNFIGIYLLCFLFYGLIFKTEVQIPYPKFILLLLCLLVFSFSPNLKTALEDVFSKDALGFRAYKLAVYKEIKDCKSDTCEVTYKNFKLSNIPDQEFIYPGESGFVLSHKLFVSRFFKKEVIRYKPSTLPPELRNGK